MQPTHFRPHVKRNALSFSDDPFDPWRLRTSRAGESRSPRAVGSLPAKRSASQDSTNGPTILGLSAKSLEGVEVGFSDCPARDRPRLAKEAFQTLLVSIIPAHESRPASDQRRYSKTGEDDGRSQCGLGRTTNSWGTAQAGNRGFRTYGFPIMPKRSTTPSQTWRTFLDNHVRDLVSIDFFTVPTARLHVLFVFIVLSHEHRRVIHFNVTEHPTATWTAQQIVEAFPEDQAPRYLIRDRDGIYGEYFQHRVQGMGIREVTFVIIMN